ncbi:hypothetical protein GP486_001257 [Trichoglossum hirsutum]|uniref:Uncharacterized protein n=1 Tax=Trichoglossum hirsutum TaxID=265104 RepID=A0A9P8LH07_9PEZI|nr:hypothetical protein GP486_001257 [Trichoglossum hirsutum]
MSLSPNERPAGHPNRSAKDPSGHYVYQPASAACTQQIIDEGLKQPSSIYSFTSRRPSPTPSSRSLNFNPSGDAQNAKPSGSGSVGTASSYKQALADAELRDGGFQPGLEARQQSWNEQDLKRMMQKKTLGPDGAKTQGFSEEVHENAGGGV